MSGQLRTPFGLVPEWVDERVTDGTAMRVYVRLARKYANVARDAFPEEITLADELGVSERTVRRCLGTLTDVGAIRITRTRRADGHYGRNLYHLPMDEPADHRSSVSGGSDQGKPEHHRTPVAGGPPDTSGRSKGNQTHVTPQPDKPLTPSSNSDEFEDLSAHTRARTRAHARRGASNPGQGEQLALLEPSGPVEAVVPIHRKAEETFARFWQVYPLKKAKGDAWKAWLKAVKTTDPDVIIEGVGRYVTELRASGAYTAYPATWLNGQRWLDEPAAAGNARAGGSDTRSNGYRPYQQDVDRQGAAEWCEEAARTGAIFG